MNNEGYRVFVIIIIAVCLLNIAVYWVDYIQLSYNLENPLIPKKALLGHVLKFTLIRSALKLIIAGICGWCLLAKRFFWPIAVGSLLILMIEAIFQAEIYSYIMP